MRYAVTVATPAVKGGWLKMKFAHFEHAAAVARSANAPVFEHCEDGRVREMCPYSGTYIPEGWTVSYGAP